MKMTIAAVVLGLSASAALAQSRTGPAVQFEGPTGPVTVTSVQPPLPNADHYRIRVADLDHDGDGFIQRAEVPESHALASEFRLVDSNRDGKISADELANWK
jgi:hypothetical protein